MVEPFTPSTPPDQGGWTVPLPPEPGPEPAPEPGPELSTEPGPDVINDLVVEALAAEPVVEAVAELSLPQAQAAEVIPPSLPGGEPAGFTEPAVAATLLAPASTAESGPGGEWALLVAKVQEWIGGGGLEGTFERYRSPLKMLGALVGIVLVLRLYGAVIGAIESLPLLPGLLELVGVVWLANFSATKLTRAQERRRLIEGLEKKWQSFRGHS
ncbi:MAG: hypothetical protein DCF23_10050 [Cyanobium sp.]|nr:MAG: hypothetical protein DCF23_10050 [Cyanobium sp.]